MKHYEEELRKQARRLENIERKRVKSWKRCAKLLGTLETADPKTAAELRKAMFLARAAECIQHESDVQLLTQTRDTLCTARMRLKCISQERDAYRNLSSILLLTQ